MTISQFSATVNEAPASILKRFREMNVEPNQYNAHPAAAFDCGDEAHLERWENRGFVGLPGREATADDPMDLDFPSEPLPCQESRCSSDEPIHHRAGLESQVDELLEDWPRRASSCCPPVNSQDWESLCRQLGGEEQPQRQRQRPSRKVMFSERSSMHVYHPDPFYVRSKSYTKEDRKTFGSAALSEAIRIKRLVLSAPGHASTKDSFKYLLKNGVISLEEIVGIEHLVLGKSASKLLRERQEHARAVLTEQDRMGRARAEEEMSARRLRMKQRECNGDACEMLGSFAASRSVKSVKRARIRAAMAA